MTTEINRTLLGVLRIDLNAAIADVGKKHGVALSVGNATFARDGKTATYKLDVAVPEGTGAEGASAKTLKQRAEWTRAARLFGLDPAWLDQTFLYGGRPLKIVGLEPNRRKNPVVVEMTLATGAVAERIMPAEQVVLYMQAQMKKAA